MENASQKNGQNESTPATFTSSSTSPLNITSNEYVLNFAFLSFVGFLLVQAVFAIIANSQAMLADCEAMAVDALTYLFNLWAERAKKMPLDNEREMTRHERTYHRELRRLYLELIPPSISCSTLVMITFFTLRQSISTLMGYAEGEEEDVSVVIMMIFSSANLLLDIVNVTCFARASSLFGLDVVRRENKAIYEAIAHEQTPLIVGDAETSEEVAEPSNGESIWSRVPVHKFHHHLDLVNLNMCSAWTVRDLNMDSIEPVASSHFIAILGCFHSTFARTRYVLCAFFGKQ